MKKRLKLSTALFALLGVSSLNAQTVSLVGTSATAISPTINTFGGSSSTRVGYGAGASFTTANSLYTGGNSFFGNNAGNLSVSGANNNCFFGLNAGKSNITGSSNVFVGVDSGKNNKKGSYNICIGQEAGSNDGNLNDNTNANGYIGHGSAANIKGYSNTFVGHMTGFSSVSKDITGSVFIGAAAGQQATTSNTLYIANSNTQNPLIWGDFAASQLKFNGKVGIGTSATNFINFPTTSGFSQYNLMVKGGILTEEVRVMIASTWADYVFASNYNLKPLSEVEAFIKTNKHLPNVPSAKTVKEEGIELGEMAKIQQEKIEELTLYLIQQNKEIQELKAQVNALISKK